MLLFNLISTCLPLSTKVIPVTIWWQSKEHQKVPNATTNKDAKKKKKEKERRKEGREGEKSSFQPVKPTFQQVNPASS